MSPLVFGFGVGLGVAAWRQWPQLPGQEWQASVVLVLLMLFVAYRAGRRGQGSTSATATATATATAVAAPVQAVQIVVGQGARDVAESQMYGSLEAAQWRGGRDLVGEAVALEALDQGVLEDAAADLMALRDIE